MSFIGAVGGAWAAKMWLAVEILGNGRLDQVQALQANIAGNTIKCMIGGIVVGDVFVFIWYLVTKAER